MRGWNAPFIDRFVLLWAKHRITNFFGDIHLVLVKDPEKIQRIVEQITYFASSAEALVDLRL